MSNLTVQEHNLQTGKIVEREMTEEEKKQHLADVEERTNNYQAAIEKEAIRNSALSKLIDLGLTEEEIAAL